MFTELNCWSSQVKILLILGYEGAGRNDFEWFPSQKLATPQSQPPSNLPKTEKNSYTAIRTACTILTIFKYHSLLTTI